MIVVLVGGCKYSDIGTGGTLQFLYKIVKVYYKLAVNTDVMGKNENEYTNWTKLLGQMLYYMLTTGAGKQTLGGEYCDIPQVAGPYELSPTPARRALFIFYQSAVPYIAEKVSSRAASHDITLADLMADYPFGDVPTSSNEAEASSTVEIQSTSTSTPSISALSRLKAR